MGTVDGVFGVAAVALSSAVAIIAVAVLAFPVARRSWPWATALVVGAYACAWTWIDWLRTPASVVYWGALLALLASLASTLSLRRGRLWLIAAALCAAGLSASALWSIDARHTLSELVRFAPALLLAALVADRASRPTERASFVGALAVLAPAAILASLFAAVALEDEIPQQLGGISGIFDAPNFFGIFVAVTLPFLLAQRSVAAAPALGLGSVGLAGFFVALSAGRAGLVALGVALVVFGVALRTWRALGVSLLCLTAAAALAVTWSPAIPTFGQQTGLVAGTESTSETAGSAAEPGQLLGGDRPTGQSLLSSLLGGRDEAWRESWRIFTYHPALGNGFGTGAMLFDRYGSRDRFTYFVGALGGGQNPHNAYVQALLELGVIGSALLLLPLLLAGGRAVWLVTRRDVAVETIALCSSLAAFLVAALFEGLFTAAGAVTLLGWIVAGAVLGTAATQRDPVDGRRRASIARLGARRPKGASPASVPRA